MGSMDNLRSLFGENDEKFTLKFRDLYQIFWGGERSQVALHSRTERDSSSLLFAFFIAFGAICDKFDGIIDNPVHFSELGERRQSGPSIGTLMLVVTLRCSNSYTNDSNQRYS